MIRYCTICGTQQTSVGSTGRGACCTDRTYTARKIRHCCMCGKQYANRGQRGGRGPCCHNIHVVPGALAHMTLPYLEDTNARLFVMITKGATLDLVGGMFGVSRERIRQIEHIALRKLRWKCIELGLEPEDILFYLQQREHGIAERSTSPLATGPTEEMRAHKELLDAQHDDDHRTRDFRGPLPEVFYAEENIAMEWRFSTQVEESAAFLEEITRRAFPLDDVCSHV